METTKTPPNGTTSAATTTTPLTTLTAWPARWLWQRPTVAVARALLAEYLMSGKVIVEAVALAVFFLFAFSIPNGSAHFFEAAHVGLGILALIAGVVAVAYAFQPRIYTPLAARHGSAATAQGLALALATVRLGSYLYLLALALLTGKLAGATFGSMVAGSIGLLANVILLSLVAAALCPPFVTSLQRIGFLLWLVAALYSYADNGLLAHICAVARLPLLPVGALFAAGVTGSLGWGGLLALLVVAVYALGLVWLLSWRLATRALPADSPAADTPATES